MYLINTNVFGFDIKDLANGSWSTPTSPKFLNDCLSGSGSLKVSFLKGLLSSRGPLPLWVLAPTSASVQLSPS